MSKFQFDKLLNKITGTDEQTRYLGRDAVKRLKELGVFNTKGDLEVKVEMVPMIERMWSIEQGNVNYAIPKGTIYELLTSYCLPFLFYKQTVLFNRVCFLFSLIN